jgi:hypothetical protein
VHTHLKGEKIDLIKLDTEANEHRVLRGAENVLKSHRPIIQCEILKNQIEKEIDEILQPHHYKYFRAEERGLVSVKDFLNNKTPYQDYYLVPSEKMASVKEFIVS